MLFAGLRGEVGSGRNNDPRDILGLNRAFAALGRLRAPDGGFGEFIDKPLADTIERFQADRGLMIDGFLRPGGETERNIRRDLGGGPKEKPFDVRTLDLSGPVGNGRDNPERDIQAVGRALGRLGLFSFDRTSEPPSLITKGFDDAIQAFQRREGLRIDGNLDPGGETIRALATAVRRAEGTAGQQAAGPAPRAGKPEKPDREQPGSDHAGPRPKIVLPEGGRIRNDPLGMGRFGAPRGGGTRRHKGVDITVTPGQPVPSPIDGVVTFTRNAYSKNNKGLRSTHIEGTGKYTGITVKVLYVDNIDLKMGTMVKAGVPMGKAQDVRVKHGERMLPHVHYEIFRDGKVIDPTNLLPIGK